MRDIGKMLYSYSASINIRLVLSERKGAGPQRFGGRAGEVHVFGDDDATIERNIVIEGRGQYPQVVCD
jgi:hypothetical protein